MTQFDNRATSTLALYDINIIDIDIDIVIVIVIIIIIIIIIIKSYISITHWTGYRPLANHGNTAIWGTKQKKFSLLGDEIYSRLKKILLFCTPDWLHSQGRARRLVFTLER